MLFRSLRNFQKKIGAPVVGKKKSMGEEYGPMESEGGVPMTPKQKKFAKLAPPADKITFADKIAGAKKEVDEWLRAPSYAKAYEMRQQQRIDTEENEFIT